MDMVYLPKRIHIRDGCMDMDLSLIKMHIGMMDGYGPLGDEDASN